MTDKKILWLIVGISLMAITLGIGWLRFEHKQEELKRNRKYEVSLVKALKNSYEGIEEIHIANPSYSSKPSDAWGADVKILFDNSTVIEHEMAHVIKSKEIRLGIYDDEDKEVDLFLRSRQGKTSSRVQVFYSDGTREKQ